MTRMNPDRKRHVLPSVPLWAVCGCFFSASLCLRGESAFAQSAPALIRKGNEQFHSGDYAGALKTFEEAGKINPDSLEARFNRGVAAYKAGDLDLAERMFREVDSSAGNPRLASAARYNLGVVEAQRLRADPPKDPRSALDRLSRTASLFRGALDLDPADADAARNLELTRRAIHELRQLIEQQKQLQQALQNIRDQLQQNQQEQQQAAERNRERAEQQQDRQDQQPPRDQREAQAEQEQISEQTQAAQRQLDQLKQRMQPGGQQPADDPLEQASRSLDEALRKQEQAKEQLGKGDFDAARREQEQAAERLREAVDQLGGGERREREQSAQAEAEPREQEQAEAEKQDQDRQARDQREEEGQDLQSPGEEVDSSTDARLARILDKERRDRELKKEVLKAAHAHNRPVEKDW